MSNLETAPVETEVDCQPEGPVAQLLPGREVALGRYTLVHRLLPDRERRMVGGWCFLDHYGPDSVIDMPGMQVPPHPHTGLQTVTWLFEGEVLHRDSLGNTQTIQPGQLNLMTSGYGIAHAEQSPAQRPPQLHGLQLWLALPAADRDGPARFEHHAALPSYRAPGVEGRVVIGSLGDTVSPARVHTPLVGAELTVAGTATLPLRPEWEYAVLAVDGPLSVAGTPVARGELLYLGLGRSTVPVRAEEPVRMFLLGGEPFSEDLVMWWNFVGRTHEEIVTARAQWQAHDDRFGAVPGWDGPPLPAPDLPAVRLKARDRRGRTL